MSNEIQLNIKKRKEKAKEIINYINDYFGVNCLELTRKKTIVLPRQMAMYYIYKNIDLSLNAIGQLFPSNFKNQTHKDHATVIHAKKTIENLIEVDKEIQMFDNDLRKTCKLISKLDEKELKKHLLIKELNNIFEKQSLESLINLKNNYKMKDNELKKLMWLQEPRTYEDRKCVYLDCEGKNYNLRAFLDVSGDKFELEIINENSEKIILTESQQDLVYNYLLEKYKSSLDNSNAFTFQDFEHFNNLRFQ